MICDSHLDWSNVQPLAGNIAVSPILSVKRVQRIEVFSLHTLVSFVNDDGNWDRRGHTNSFDQGERRMLSMKHEDGTTITFSIEGDILTIDKGGKRARVLLRAFDRLRDATEDELAQFEIIDGGDGISWPSLSEDLHVPSLIAEFGK